MYLLHLIFKRLPWFVFNLLLSDFNKHAEEKMVLLFKANTILIKGIKFHVYDFKFNIDIVYTEIEFELKHIFTK